MIRNLMKLSVLGVVSIISMHTSSRVINRLVIEVNSKETTITDAIIQQQVEVAFEEAEKKIQEVLEKEDIVIEVEEVKMKPPLPEDEPKPEVVTKPEDEVLGEEVGEVEGNEEEEVSAAEQTTEATGGLENVDLSQYSELTGEDIEYIGNYLIDNYFLHGYVYYSNEEDPTKQQRKKLTHEMEGYVIESLGSAFGLITDLTSINGDTLGNMKAKAIELAEAFATDYAKVESSGEEFKAIYDEALEYFEIYITTLDKAETTIRTIEKTSNKLLVLPLMLKSINEDLLPGAKEVLDQGFALKAKTNAIYTEGIDASFLLEPREVVEIILNPSSILPNQPVVPDTGITTETTDEVEGGTEVPEEKVEGGTEVSEDEVEGGTEVPEDEVEGGTEVPEDEVEGGTEVLEDEVGDETEVPEDEVELETEVPEDEVELETEVPEDEVEVGTEVSEEEVEGGVITPEEE